MPYHITPDIVKFYASRHCIALQIIFSNAVNLAIAAKMAAP